MSSPRIDTPLTPDDDAGWEAIRLAYFDHAPVNLNPATLGTPSTLVFGARWDQEQHAFPLGTYQRGRAALLEARQLCTAIWPKTPAPAIGGSTTDIMNALALNLVILRANALPLKVYTSGHEHYGGVAFFERHPAFDVHYLEDESLDDPQAMAKAVADSDILFLSHITYTEGRLLPIDAIFEAAKAQNPALLCLADAAQSTGLLPPPTAFADAVITSAHKWLCGPGGNGFLWLSQAFKAQLGAIFWAGHAFDAQSEMGDFEPNGGQDFSRFPALVEALKLYQRLGPAAIAARSSHLRDFLEAHLLQAFSDCGVTVTALAANYKRSPGMFSLHFENIDAYPIYDALNRAGVHMKCIKTQLPTGRQLNALRIGIPYYENKTRLLTAAQKMVAVAETLPKLRA